MLKDKNLLKEEAKKILVEFNKKTGANFRESEVQLKYIVARLNDGVSYEDCIKVIDNRVAKWRGDPEREQYLRPSTVFRPSNFENYLSDATKRPSLAGAIQTGCDAVRHNLTICSVPNCGLPAVRDRYYKGKEYCQPHMAEAYANDYDHSKDNTPEAKDRMSRFLIRMGSKSVWWRKATEEQRQAALRYYKQHGETQVTVAGNIQSAIKSVCLEPSGEMVVK